MTERPTVRAGELISGMVEEISIYRAAVLRYLAVFIPLEFVASLTDSMIGTSNSLDATGLSARAGFANGPVGLLALLVNVYGQLLLFRQMLRANTVAGTPPGHYLGFLALGILTFLGVSFSTLFFVVPGLFVAARWLMSPAFFATGETGVFGAMSASWRGTRGCTKAVMLALLVMLLIYLFAAALVGSLFSGLSAIGETARDLGAALASAAAGEIWSVLLISLSVATYRGIAQPVRKLTEVFA